MSKPIYVAFASPKGGVGKTTLTVLTATYLHYTKDFSVAIVDCCYPEYGIGLLRKNEIERINKEEHYNAMARQQFTTIKKHTYPIIDTRVENAIRDAEPLQNVDVIFFDLPAVMSVDGTVELLAAMDYLIFPIINGSWVINTVQQFIETMNQHVITTGKSNIKEIYLLRNKVSTWDDVTFTTACKAMTDQAGVTLMATSLLESNHLKKNIFYTQKPEICVSTIFPCDKHIPIQDMINQCMDEIEQIVKEPCGKSL